MDCEVLGSTSTGASRLLSGKLVRYPNPASQLGCDRRCALAHCEFRRRASLHRVVSHDGASHSIADRDVVWRYRADNPEFSQPAQRYDRDCATREAPRAIVVSGASVARFDRSIACAKLAQPRAATQFGESCEREPERHAKLAAVLTFGCVDERGSTPHLRAAARSGTSRSGLSRTCRPK